jgi:hypothetical protein
MMPRFGTRTNIEHALRWDMVIERHQTIDLFGRAPTEPGSTAIWQHLAKRTVLGRTTIGPQSGFWMMLDLLPDWNDALIRVWIGDVPRDFDGAFLRRAHERLRVLPEAQSMLGRTLIVPERQGLAVEVMEAGHGGFPVVVKMRWIHSYETETPPTDSLVPR